mgnify:CR=1 FL=1
MSDYLNKAATEIGKSRKEVIDRLVVFSQTDMLLFWGHEKDLIERQEKVWGPILQWANNEINVEFVKTQGLDVPENKASGEKLKDYLNSFSDKELAAFYVAALNMKSVLLAIALVKKRLSADEAFNAAFLDELWQAESWGVEKEAEKRRIELKKELHEIEDFLK